MPGLPEVEATRRYLVAQKLPGRTIIGVTVRWANVVKAAPTGGLEKALKGKRVTEIARRAKFLLLRLDNGLTLILHLGMTGSLVVESAGSTPSPYAHTVFALDGGRELRFRDPRKFGKVWLVQDEDKVVGTLGPEPLDSGFTVQVLAQALGKRKVPIKALLCEQSVIAGVGNIYADEALWRARIHPLRFGSELTTAEVKRLHEAIPAVLEQAIEKTIKVASNGGMWVEGAEDYDRLHVPREAGAACERCGTSIKRILVRARGTYYCPTCQAAGSSAEAG